MNFCCLINAKWTKISIFKYKRGILAYIKHSINSGKQLFLNNSITCQDKYKHVKYYWVIPQELLILSLIAFIISQIKI